MTWLRCLVTSKTPSAKADAKSCQDDDEQLASVLGALPHASLPQAADDPAPVKAAYRFFDNDYIRAEAMLVSHVASTQRRMQAVQDTSVLDWTTHPATTGGGRSPHRRRATKGCWPTPRWQSVPTAFRWACSRSRSGRVTRRCAGSPNWVVSRAAKAMDIPG